jgi:hypothetical protein
MLKSTLSQNKGSHSRYCLIINCFYGMMSNGEKRRELRGQPLFVYIEFETATSL